MLGAIIYPVMQNAHRLDSQFVPWVALIRAVAIFMVLAAHISDNVSPDERLTEAYKSWVPYYGSFLRPCVPFFVMLTGFLLLPVKEDIGGFLKKRLPRVLIPFVIWVVIYNSIPYVISGIMGKPASAINFLFAWYDPATISVSSFSDVLINSAKSLLFFNVFTTHLWYIFVVMGLYLYLPIFSAWVQQASDRAKLYFLAIWALSLFLPYLRTYADPHALGACGWNEFNMLYYFAGFNGYLLLGHVLGRMPQLSWARSLAYALPMLVIGYWITLSGFAHSLDIPNATEAQVELFFTYCSPNVVLLTVACFLLLKRVRINIDCLQKPLQSLSRCSFGIYLSHYLFLGPVFHAALTLDMSTPLKMTLATLVALAINWLFVYLLSRLPHSRYIIG